MSKTLTKEQLSKLVFSTIQESVDHPLTFFKVFKNNKGTRFTGLGFDLAGFLWKSYTVKLPDNYKIANKTLLMLDAKMEWPYYLSKKKLVLFSEMDAFEFSLYQGDINLWANK